MTYIDGYVCSVPTENKEKYKKIAQESAEVFKDAGALHVIESWGEDVPEGEVTSFPMAVKRQPNETVVFSWVVWPSRSARDEGNKKAMSDPRMQVDPSLFPFDGKRLIYGGFEVIVDM